jgi:tetratricopeptide (TPR) repeat protein
MKKIFLLILVSALFSKEILAQTAYSTTSKKAIGLYLDADNFRVRGEFDKAIDLLNQAISKDTNFEEAYFRLGLTYKNKEDIKLSSDNFEKGLTLTTDAKKQKNYQYELGENYLSVGSYVKSKGILNRFLQIEKINNKKIDQATLWLLQADYALAHANEKLDFRNQVLSDSVNSYPNQYFPVLTADDQE